MSRLRVCTVSLLAMAAMASSSSGQSAVKVVHVVAERFSFTPSDITVDQGTVIELRITSEDTAHGFKVVGPKGTSDINVEVPKRGRGDVKVTFDAREPGTYVFECSRVCGAGHGFMRGTIRVKGRSAS
jgi:cytochrome c oxidase subunit 2